MVQDNGNGRYTVWLCCDGRWRAVVIDDRVPTSQLGHPIGAMPYISEGYSDIGVMLIEKAFAK